jgi:ABC-type antimicrobial peptide transport system permease subunit
MNQNEKINKDVENLEVSVDLIGQSIQGIIENEKLMMSTIKNLKTAVNALSLAVIVIIVGYIIGLLLLLH